MTSPATPAPKPTPAPSAKPTAPSGPADAKPLAMIIGGGSGIGADAAKKMHELGHDVAILSSSGKGEAFRYIIAAPPLVVKSVI